ncbi:MAG: cation:proton antiporter [Bacteroidales bacterium]|nr:cation:proton antiporter [Bacteroidales bacterium]
MHHYLLQDILILSAFSVVIVFLLQRIKIPSIIGFLITGIIIGPFGFSLVKAVETVDAISEIGVIFLLFVIGMELSIKQLVSIKKTVFIGGFLQVALTIIVTGAICFLLGLSWNESLFVGFLFSLSSTAIVLKVFQDRNETTSPHARNALGILIFQDIIVVPMMLFTPILAGQSTNVTMSIIILVLKSIGIIGISFFSARYLIPKLMYAIVKTRSKELFLLTTITICFAIAFLTNEAGLSLALGAFLAGLIISESEYSHQATTIILPFRELFTSFFFISVGMMLNLHFFLNHAGFVMLIVLGLLLVKTAIAAAAVAVLKYPARTILLTGFSLFQVGEFAFILSKIGLNNQLLSNDLNQIFLSVSIVSMLLTPFVIMVSEHFTYRFLRTRLGKKISKNTSTINQKGEKTKPIKLSNHLVIIGYGVNGANLAKAAQFSNIPFVVLEMNAETVRNERKKGIPILFGDATQAHMLNLVNLKYARAVVLAISDPRAAKSIIGTIRQLSQSIYLLVRSRYAKKTPELIALGADDVIPADIETSIEIFSRVLRKFLIPEKDIEHLIESVRADDYNLFQNDKKIPLTIRHNLFPELNITCLRVIKDSGSCINKPLKELDFRARFKINILAIARNGNILDHIGPNEVLQRDDCLYLVGKNENIEEFQKNIM